MCLVAMPLTTTTKILGGLGASTVVGAAVTGFVAAVPWWVLVLLFVTCVVPFIGMAMIWVANVLVIDIRSVGAQTTAPRGNICSVSSQGSPYARFRRALANGTLLMIRAAAAELPRIDLADALAITLVIEAHDDEHYDRAVARWIGRFALECPAVTMSDLGTALDAFTALPDPDASRTLADQPGSRLRREAPTSPHRRPETGSSGPRPSSGRQAIGNTPAHSRRGTVRTRGGSGLTGTAVPTPELPRVPPELPRDGVFWGLIES
jgi:hypothetical protein